MNASTVQKNGEGLSNSAGAAARTEGRRRVEDLRVAALACRDAQVAPLARARQAPALLAELLRLLALAWATQMHGRRGPMRRHGLEIEKSSGKVGML